jgi:branched-chain amino acid transport system substrate-binding protein
LWDDPRIFADTRIEGGWFAAPDQAGFRSFAERYRARYNQDPVRTATLAYDAVALVAALVKTQGAQRFTEQILTNASGFSGIDGVFRFRSDGTNERGLAVLRVAPAGGQTISPPPKSFTPGT